MKAPIPLSYWRDDAAGLLDADVGRVRCDEDQPLGKLRTVGCVEHQRRLVAGQQHESRRCAGCCEHCLHQDVRRTRPSILDVGPPTLSVPCDQIRAHRGEIGCGQSKVADEQCGAVGMHLLGQRDCAALRAEHELIGEDRSERGEQTVDRIEMTAIGLAQARSDRSFANERDPLITESVAHLGPS